MLKNCIIISDATIVGYSLIAQNLHTTGHLVQYPGELEESDHDTRCPAQTHTINECSRVDSAILPVGCRDRDLRNGKESGLAYPHGVSLQETPSGSIYKNSSKN